MIFDPVTLATGFMLVKLGACPMQKPVEVNVRFTHKEQPYEMGLTSQQLTARFGNDPDSTSSTDGKWMVSGLNKSDIQAGYQVHFDMHQNRKSGDTCFAIKSVDYEIIYTNTIYIASDYKDMGCRYSATMMHEKRHVQIDKRTLTDFIPYIKQTIGKIAYAIGPQGPYPAATVEAERQRTVQVMAQALRPLLDEMAKIRRERQATIDTVESYRRDTALCPGQFPEFAQ